MREARGLLVRGLEEKHELALRRRSAADRFIGQEELAQALLVARGGRLHAGGLESRGLRRRVRIERRLLEAGAPGPEAMADHLMRISLARDRIRSRIRRRAATGEARECQVEA